MSAARLLEDRAAIVTGAGQGLGFAIAQEFAAAGARVLVADIDPEIGAAAVAAIARDGGTARFVQTDVRDETSVDAAVASCIEAFGALDVVVNNAGVIKPKSLRSMSVDEWDQMADVHLKGSWLMMRAASRPMIEQQHGNIVNISSIVAKTGGIAQGHYAAMKAGIVGLTKSGAKEWARHGIRVNALQPGLFSTPTSQLMAEDAWQTRVDNTPLGRAGEPRELATAALFFASDLSSFVTGAVLEVTGGRDM